MTGIACDSPDNPIISLIMLRPAGSAHEVWSSVSAGFRPIFRWFTTDFGIENYMNVWRIIQLMHQRQKICNLVFFLTLKPYRSQNYTERLEALIHDLLMVN